MQGLRAIFQMLLSDAVLATLARAVMLTRLPDHTDQFCHHEQANLSFPGTQPPSW